MSFRIKYFLPFNLVIIMRSLKRKMKRSSLSTNARTSRMNRRFASTKSFTPSILFCKSRRISNSLVCSLVVFECCVLILNATEFRKKPDTDYPHHHHHHYHHQTFVVSLMIARSNVKMDGKPRFIFSTTSPRTWSHIDLVFFSFAQSTHF